MSDVKFYYCTICGNIIEKIHDSGLTPMCCMRDMEELKAGMTDGRFESHVPICETSGRKVRICVGAEPHPMEKDHFIEWIELVTDKGIYRRHLNPGDEPFAKFRLCKNEKITDVFAYCNRHKLWRGAMPADDMDYDRYTDD